MKNLFSFKNHVKSISLLIVLILFYSAITQAQSSNQFFNQNQFDPRTDFPLVFVNGQAVPRQQTEGPVWENIQSVSIPQQISPGIFAKPVSIDLDQVRNGSADSRLEPPNWVNGNAGQSNAHYVEGYSIPYRLVIENLVGTGLRSVDIEWDTRHSGANAIDFITNFDLIDFPVNSHAFNFAHPQETINPLSPEGFIVTDGNPTSPNIPMPANLVALAQNTFNAIQAADKGSFGIWGATITPVAGFPTGLRYIDQDPLTGAQSSTRLRIYFTNTGPTVIISWGGHIAKGADWGAGNSASAVSGSPYHTRTIEWDPQGDDDSPESLGNQDRSLSAEAVLDPPVCLLGDPTSIECSTSSTFTSGVAASDLANDVTFGWSVINNTCGSAPTLTNPTVGSVTVNAPSVCGCAFTLRYALIKNNLVVSQCVKLFTVTDTHAPGFTSTPNGSDLGCNPGGLPATVNPTATDNCGTPTVTPSDGNISTNGCSRSQTRTYTARDACNNTATIGQTFTWTADATGPVFTACPAGSDLGCSPQSIPEPGAASATDNCGTPTITSSLGAEVGAGCNKTRTRTYTARDACGNSSTCQQVFTYRVDATPPVFTACQPDVTVECGSPTSTAALGSATASDGCGSPTVTANDATPVQVGCQTVIVRTWTARDACSHTATCVQRILIIDRTPPTITCNADGSATASDGCGSYYLYQNGTRWTAIDASGNIRTATCVVAPGARITSSEITEEQKEQTNTSVTEEKTKAAVSAKLILQNNISVQTLPNPFNDKVKFIVTTPEAGYGTLEVMNMLGQKVKTVFQGRIAAGGQSFEMVLPKSRNTTLLYIFRMNGKQVTGKLIQMN